MKLALLLSVLSLAACTSVDAPMSRAPDTAAGASYHLLMAEIARERGTWSIAAEEYLQAARFSEDPQTARRATEFAVEYGYDALGLESARRWLELQPDAADAHQHAGRFLAAAA